MAGLNVQYTEAETKKLISDTAAANGDKFRIRVHRRKNSGGVEVVASFEEAMAEHVAAPEKWLPDLAGGGNYILHVMHDTTGLNVIGDGIPFNVDNMPPHQINPDIVQNSDWSGPRVLTWPKKMLRTTPLQTSSVSGFGYDIEPGGGSTPVGARVMDGSEGWSKAQMFEKQLADLRRNNEVESIRREYTERLKSVETSQANTINSLRDEIRALRTDALKPHESVMDSLSKALAPLVPVFQSMITGQNEMRIKIMEQQAATAQAQLQATREAAERFEKTITMLITLTKKEGMDPAVTMLIEYMKSHADNPAKGMLTDVISAISGMSNAAMQVMTTAMDAGLGGDRGGTAEIVREVAGAAGSFFQMMAESKQQQQQLGQRPQQQRLPARAQVIGQQPAPGQEPKPQPITVLDTMIKKHHDPVMTARFFLDALERDPDIRSRFAQAGNDIEPFFERYWGQWALQNVGAHGPYVTALRDAVLAGANARGWNKEAPQQAAPPPQQPPQAPRPALSVVPRRNGNGAPAEAAAFAGETPDGQPIDPNEDPEDPEDPEEEDEVEQDPS